MKYLLSDSDIILNDIIFSEVQNAKPTDSDIDIYNRVADYITISSLEQCVKVLELIHTNIYIHQRLKTI